VSRARGYLREVLEPQKVDKLLKRPDLTYRDIALGFPRFRGQASRLHMSDCRGCCGALLVIDRTEETNR
jgi:hypothetical protein